MSIPQDTENPTIDPADLIDRRIYRIRSRNLVVGTWSAVAQGFIGIREKFGSRYLFTEYEYTLQRGTARAVDDLRVDVPTGIEMRENLDTRCSDHDQLCSWSPNEPGGSLGTWRHEDGVPLYSWDQPESPLNQPLFDLLVSMEPIAEELRRLEWEESDRAWKAIEAARTPEEVEAIEAAARADLAANRSRYREEMARRKAEGEGR